MKLKGIEIKPGMVIITKSTMYVAFPSKRPNYPIVFANTTSGGWALTIPETYIEEIRGLLADRGGLDSGELLWTKEWDRELTMDEIAEKFDIPVKYLRIKKEQILAE